MPLAIRDRKILWARSGNRCAFPGCAQELVERGCGQAANIVIGEEAHISARRPSGPRGIGTGGDDTYDNLLLLCPTHHRIIDEQPAVFTMQTLNAFKVAHEARVRESSLSSSWGVMIDPAHHVS